MSAGRDTIRSLKELPREDLEAVSNVQNHLVGVTMGQQPFEHPGAPRVAPGSRYMPNQVETEFATKSRSTLMTNFIRHVVVGSLTPYIALRGLSVLQKRVIPNTRYMIWAGLGAGFGGMYGLTVGRFVVAIDYIKLEHSPLATEARFQLWKQRPHHPYLSGFEHETSEWEEMRYRDSRDSFHDDQHSGNSRGYDDYDQFGDRRSNSMKPPPPPLLHGNYSQKPRSQRDSRGDDRYDNRYDDREPVDRRRRGGGGSAGGYSDYGASSNEDDHEMMRRRKRDRFYEGRNRVDNNSLNDDMGGYDDIGEFFDSSGGRSGFGHDGAGDFFESQDRQKWE